jgi:hypothetical protein
MDMGLDMAGVAAIPHWRLAGQAPFSVGLRTILLFPHLLRCVRPSMCLQIGQKDPYTELPRHHVRGLPTLDRQYYYRRMAAPSPQTPPGMKAVFSTNRATTDLSIMKEYGLVSKSEYEKKRKQIDATSLDPWVTRRALPRPLDPEGWTGPSKMCRDVTTETGKGLSGEGYAKLNTLRCCSFMCERSEWLALRQGQLKGGYGLENRQTFAVDTGGAGKMADGSDKYLCRSCAWYREPSWAELNMHELTKMEGHIPGPFSNVTVGNSTDAGSDEGEGEEAAEGEA